MSTPVTSCLAHETLVQLWPTVVPGALGVNLASEMCVYHVYRDQDFSLIITASDPLHDVIVTYRDLPLPTVIYRYLP